MVKGSELMLRNTGSAVGMPGIASTCTRAMGFPDAAATFILMGFVRATDTQRETILFQPVNDQLI